MTEQGNEKPSIVGLARVRLGHSQLTVRPVGLGCMGMSQFYGAADDNESINTLREAIDLGVNFLDTSDIYGAADIGLGASIRGFGHNEQLIGQAIAGRRGDKREVARRGCLGCQVNREPTAVPRRRVVVVPNA
jgi:predicted oxidoreductase